MLSLVTDNNPPLLSTGSAQEDRKASRHDLNIDDLNVKPQNKHAKIESLKKPDD